MQPLNLKCHRRPRFDDSGAGGAIKNQTTVSITSAKLQRPLLMFVSVEFVPKSPSPKKSRLTQTCSDRPIFVLFLVLRVGLFERTDTYVRIQVGGRSDRAMGGHGRPLTRDSLVSTAHLPLLFPHLKSLSSHSSTCSDLYLMPSLCLGLFTLH